MKFKKLNILIFLTIGFIAMIFTMNYMNWFNTNEIGIIGSSFVGVGTLLIYHVYEIKNNEKMNVFKGRRNIN